jgi:hypothetical protein
MILRRSRFRDLVDRQLDLFATDEAELLTEADEADAAWTNAGRDETEELYGDYQLVVDAIGDRLYDLREAYASTLDETAAGEYREAFDSAAAKRFRRYAAFLESED